MFKSPDHQSLGSTIDTFTQIQIRNILDHVQWLCWIGLSTCSEAPMGCWMVLRDDMEEGSVEHIQHCLTICHRDTRKQKIGQAWRECCCKRGGERRFFVDNRWHMADSDWLSRFLSS